MAKSALALLVVDGYNVIHKTDRYTDLVDTDISSGSTTRLGNDPFVRARELLIADVAAYSQRRYDPVILFDGAGNINPERPPFSTGGVRLMFSRPGESADAVIERLVTEAREQMRDVTVVTSDNTIRATVGGIPVTRISSDVLIADITTLTTEYENANDERQYQHMTVEDRIDPKVREKLWRMLRN